jgi:pimeloyl-ACP methyl ester carboxylesterase
VKSVRKLQWVAGVLVALALVAGVGFWERPVSYFNGLMYARLCLAGVESHSVTVAGHTMHYYAEGPKDGPAVVLVHGLGGRGEDWRGLAPYLARAGFRVYLPDLPGYGRSAQPADFSYSISDEADAVEGFFDVLGLKQVDLGGWSMGGAIVQHIAARHPERVRRLMLFDSLGINEMPKWNIGLFTPANPEELGQLQALLTPNPRPIPGFAARDILRVSRQNAWVIHRAVNTMQTGRDATEALLPTLKMPVLIVWGAEDRIFPTAQAEKMHSLVPQSELEVFPGCGHLAPGQCAPAIGPKVVEFEKQ